MSVHYVVQTGLMDPTFGRSLNQNELVRISADHLGDPPPHDEAVEAVERAGSSVVAVAELMA